MLELRKLADTLTELRRYATSDPHHVRREIDKLAVGDIPAGLPDELWFRLCDNIYLGRRFLAADPEVIRGYLYNAAFEIRLEAEKQ